MFRRSFIIGLPSMAILASSPSAARDRKIFSIDTHSHVFTRALHHVNNSRYLVDYDATIEDYIAMLDSQGMTNGVLVQPSFLGTDNSYLIEALTRYPDRLRGVAVVPTDVADEELTAMHRRGVVGIRLNLIGKPDPDFSDPAFRRLLARLADLDWHTEIYAEAARLPKLLPPLSDFGLRVVLDHFGRPSMAEGVEDPGFRFLLGTARTHRVWVKMSGWYRLAPGAAGETLARDAAHRLLDGFGPERLLYGSDWPHTQFENIASPSQAKAHFLKWVPRPEDRRTILGPTAQRFFGFGPAMRALPPRNNMHA